MRERTDRGWTLMELLFASSLFLLIGSVALQLVAVSQAVFRSQPEAADVQQRLRVAVESLSRDIRQAGAGLSAGDAAGELFRVLPAIRPARRGLRDADGEFAARSDRVTLLWVPPGAPQTTLAADMRSPNDVLTIDAWRVGCPSDGVCGFVAGTRALVFDSRGVGRGYDVFTVTGSGSGTLLRGAPNPALSRAYERGVSWVTEVVQRTYYRDALSNRLMRYDGWMSDVPIVDDVVGFDVTIRADPDPWSVEPPGPGESSCLFPDGPAAAPSLVHLGGVAPRDLSTATLTDGPICGLTPNRFDGDLLRVRSVRVRLGLREAPVAAGVDGTTHSAMRPHRAPSWVTFDVALPNAPGGRRSGPTPPGL